MTFTEAAIEVLRREGKPLHFKKITEIAIRESLLDHVGKIPDDTMADQLVAHCRLPHTDRRLLPIQTGTFALVEWGMDEDPNGLESLIELPPEDELPYRGRERHPVPSREIARGTGRAEGRRRREEEGQRPRRFPPPSEVAYEILAGANRPLSLAEIAAQGAERLLMPDAFVRDANALRAALDEDNRRREANGRRPLFELEGEQVTLVSQPEPGDRGPAIAVRPTATAAEARRAGLAALRRKLRECEPHTVEYVVCRVLEKLGFRDLKVAKRGREHVIYTGRRRMGLQEVRHGVRILRTSAEVGRRDVTELRRDLGHYGAQIGAVVSAGEATRDARGEASSAGQLPILLLCGEALAEALLETGVGCEKIVVPDVDEAFFQKAALAAEEEEAARRARREERDRREGREGRRRDERTAEERTGEDHPGEERTPPLEEVRERATLDVSLAPTEADGEPGPVGGEEASEPQAILVDATLEDLEPEDDEEGPEGDEIEVEAVASEPGATPAAAEKTEPGSPGERRRRRRRRRRRGGRGRGREGAPAEGAPAAAASPAGAERPASEPAPSPAPPPAPPEGQGGGGGTAS